MLNAASAVVALPSLTLITMPVVVPTSPPLASVRAPVAVLNCRPRRLVHDLNVSVSAVRVACRRL